MESLFVQAQGSLTESGSSVLQGQSNSKLSLQMLSWMSINVLLQCFVKKKGYNKDFDDWLSESWE